jgi:hypothetical protein
MGTAFSRPISADGRFVAFGTSATNIVQNEWAEVRRPRSARRHVLRWSAGSRTASSGIMPTFPSISADGRYVAFGGLRIDLAGLRHVRDLGSRSTDLDDHVA